MLRAAAVTAAMVGAYLAFKWISHPKSKSRDVDGEQKRARSTDKSDEGEMIDAGDLSYDEGSGVYRPARQKD